MKNFAIIEAEDKNRIVPSAWLSADLKFLYWPPYDDTNRINKAITQLQDPEESCDPYPVKRLIQYKDNYTDAVDTLKLYVDQASDLSDTDKLKKTRSARHIKKIDEFDITVNNKKRIKSNTMKRKREDDYQIDSDSSENNTNVLDAKLPAAPSTLSVVLTSDESHSEYMTRMISDPKDDPLAVAESHTVDDVNSHEGLKITYDNDSHAQKIMNSIKQLSKRLEVIEQSMSRLLRDGIRSRNDDNRCNSQAASDRFKEYLPINEKKKSMTTLKTRLKNDKSLFESLVNLHIRAAVRTKCYLHKVYETIWFMRRKGGSTPHDHVYNILESVITNEAARYSYYGQKNNKKPFNDLFINTSIFRAVMRAFPDSTDIAIKTSIMKWFAAATTRVSRANEQGNKKKTRIVLREPPETPDLELDVDI